MMGLAVEVKNISKTFPGVRALAGVNLSVNTGEVHAVVGENGAGKSTLMKILGGVYAADDGEIFINGRKTQIRSVRDSIGSGISVIYQEFNLMPELSVAENIFITDIPRVKLINLLKLKELKIKAKKLMDKLKIDIDPTELVKNLSVSKRQMVEIVKALSRNSNIIIMDEPTAALNNQEVDKLFEIIKMLKKEKKTILYISHRLKEIFEVADRVTVLRDGRLIGTENIADLNQDKVVRMMVGRDVESYYHHSESQLGDVALTVKSLTKKKIFENIWFEVKKGEILGISGLMGCGREEIAKAIYGLTDYDCGEIYIEGRKVNIRKTRDAMRNGVAFVTEDRKDSGVFPEMTVKENISLNIISKLSRFFGTYINVKQESDLLEKYTKFTHLKYAGESQRIMYLSGGNQQKVVLARALAADCKVLVLLEPTRGIDVGAKSEIYNLLGELVNSGIAIIVISSELPELISICHRILVVWQGKITGNLTKKDINENNIMQCATGNKKIFGEVG
jgi:ABC-type sugar transport system ATPase subunit